MDFCLHISLKEVLKELCNGTVWKYAVFWRLNYGTHPILTWEDGYLETKNDHEEISLNMQKYWFPFGEGTVGEVAKTGQHQWIFANQCTIYKLLNCQDDLKLQFAAGIKTILFVPITSHGVVQLGSLYTVLEDSKLVTQIKDLFSTTLNQISDEINSSGHSPISTTSFLNLQFSPPSLLEAQNEGVENSTTNPNWSDCIGFENDCLSIIGENQTIAPQVRKRKITRTEVKKRRPRDRQLIRERITELREIIPNGSKCSIDALLERTVKQMTFLENVSTQVKKLKNYELSTNKYYNQSNGDTWTEGKIGICPLIVEDLDQPGHIFIQMICKEYDIFLEIALIIKSLKLNILEGKLESRSEKLWAHFIIEASEEFHRMHVMWPLMQLLNLTL